MRYGQNQFGPSGQENALNYPAPKWHPYYGWGYGAAAPPQPQRMIGDPNTRPPGNWFGRPVVGALAFKPESAMAVQAGAGLLVGGAAYLATKSVLGALLGGGAAALLVTLLPIWEEPSGPTRGI
jgi:hypothetical protein